MTKQQCRKRRLRRFLNAALVTVVFAFGEAVSSPLHADTYRFIVSGLPVDDVRYSAASAGTSLVTGGDTAHSWAQALEARYRTWQESAGIALRSDPASGFILIVR